MKYRKLLVIYALIPLIIGVVVYFCFRKNIVAFDYLGVTSGIWSDCQFPGDDFVRYYLPDFLWAFSLTMGLYVVCFPSKIKSYWVTLIAIVLAVLWEFLQKCGFVNGTFDWWDCAVCAIGAIVSNCVYAKFKKRMK